MGAAASQVELGDTLADDGELVDLEECGFRRSLVRV